MFNFFKQHKIFSLLAGLAVLLLACLVYVALVGISFDVTGHRANVAAKLAKNLGREVRLDGSLHFDLSAHPRLIVGGLHIANAPGFSGSEFASLGEARLALDLWPLLHLRLQVDELSGSDVKIRLQLNNEGKNNWAFQSPEKKIAPPVTDQAVSTELESLLTHLDIERVSLEKLDVEFIGANTKSHFFELQSLVAQFPAGQALTLTLHGTVEKTYPYKLDLTGGSLAELVGFDKPWPIDLTLGFMSSQLSLKGNVSTSSGTINFALGTNNLNEFERLLQTKLPAVGVTRLTGAVNYAPGKVTLDSLTGIMGKTTLNGALNFNYNGERPKVQGELTLPVLDLRPFITNQADTPNKPPQSLAEIYKEISAATFSLNELNSVDADLTLHVGQWLSLPGNVHEAMLQVKLEHGHLSVPVQATVADVTLSGNASVNASITPARFNLALGTHNSKLGNLAELLLGMSDVRGELGRFDLHIAAQGDSGSALMKSLDVRMNVERANLMYGDAASDHPVRLALNDFALALPAGKALQGETHGSLLDKTFSGTLHGGSLNDIMQEAHTPIDLELQAGSTRTKIHAVLQPPAENTGSEVTFELSAPHSGEIASWLGLKPGVDAPIGFHGNFHISKDSWHLADLSLKLGGSDLTVDLLRTFYKGKSLIKLQLIGELVDVDELESLLPESPKNTPAATQAATNIIDIPILPQSINLADADIEVRIKRIASLSPIAVRDLRFNGRIRDGMMSESPFAANVTGNDFSGTILLDLRTQQPHSVLQLSTDALDIGSLLNKLGIARDIDANVDHLRLQLDLHSSHLGQLLSESELAINFEGGHLTLHDTNTDAKMHIALNDGELKSAAGAPVSLNLHGALDNIPISIGIQTAKAADLINPNLPIPFKFNASSSIANIKLSGDIDRPFSKKDIELALDIRGVRMDKLNSLTHTSLPPWGPWSASGKFRMSSSGYEVSSLRLQVGSSQLTGQGKFDTKVVPPRIDLALTAPTIQLDDFSFGDWSPEKAKPVAAGQQMSADELHQANREASNKVQKILSTETLRRQNAYLTVRVDQVISGQDMLGNGRLEAQLENGRANIGPVIVNTPGGSASLRMGYQPGEKDVAVTLRAEVKRLDYGILARRIDKNSEMSGIFSLDVDVSARAQYLSEILRYGNGHIDFAIWPKNIKSGLLDVWAVNVLSALVPVVDSSNESKVNCAVGHFGLSNGQMSDKAILIDTSRIRVTGKGRADFAEEDIQFYLQPRAKTPQFMSVAIPIELRGKFNDFHIGVRSLDVLETMGQLASSILWVPMQMLFGKETPADGHDVCSAVNL
jgi:uncharacterized protein involved in outer membrane biogenesis